MTEGHATGKEGISKASDLGALELATQRRRRFLVFCGVLAVVVMGANLLYGTMTITRENRTHCLTCHRGSGPALMWEASERHAAGITCGQCHGRLPGQGGRCGSFSARAETVNPNCTGCHSAVLTGRPIDKLVEVRLDPVPGAREDPRVYRWPLEELMYGWHLKKGICLCTDCHRNIAHERESAAFGHSPKMSYCRECHYHAAKDDYVRISPLPKLEVKEGEREKAKGQRKEEVGGRGREPGIGPGAL
jgi:hypothetical protein